MSKQFGPVILALVFTFSFGLTATIHAATVSVSATASGGFGSQGNPGSTAFVLGFTFSGIDETIVISTAGTINLSSGATGVTPLGITALAGTTFASTLSYTPLEESLVESGALLIPRPAGDLIESIGALIGAYIPATVASDPTFSPFDEDLLALGIPSADLFLIGASSTFTAPGPGALYLGINEWFAQNNSGSFQVTINSVPIPAAVWLFGSGLLGLIGIARRRKA